MLLVVTEKCMHHCVCSNNGFTNFDTQQSERNMFLQETQCSFLIVDNNMCVGQYTIKLPH